MLLAQPVSPRGLSQSASLMQAKLLAANTTTQIRTLERSWNPRQTTYSIGQATQILVGAVNLGSRVNRQITGLEEDKVIAVVSPALEALRADTQSELVKKIQPHTQTVGLARQAGRTDTDLIELPTLRRDVLAYLRVLEGVQQNLVFLIEEKPEVAGALLLAAIAVHVAIADLVTLILELLKETVKLATWTIKYLPWIIGGGVVLIGGYMIYRGRKAKQE